jgi:hypothetical protein
MTPRGHFSIAFSSRDPQSSPAAQTSGDQREHIEKCGKQIA